MARGRRGRSVVLVLAGVLLCLGVWAAGSWRTLGVWYYAWRASGEPALLLAYSRQPPGSLRERAAMLEMERSPRARLTLFRDYVDGLLRALGEDDREGLQLAERCVALELRPARGSV